MMCLKIVTSSKIPCVRIFVYCVVVVVVVVVVSITVSFRSRCMTAKRSRR